MVNRERIVSEFVELISIDSLSLRERQMADLLKDRLKKMGFDVYEDDSGAKTGGNCGNIIGEKKGNKNAPAILLMAHMDTVTPGINKKAIVQGDIIKSDGTTILGGDDVAGIVSILEALRVMEENNEEHGDIQVTFTIGEEVGLIGAKNLDYGKIHAKYCFVMDTGGDIGVVAITAPSQNKIDIIVKGKAAHAGVEPEKGTNAISIAAHAISQMKLGRIDEETTANIGIINGGSATNIICDRVELKAEARSRSENKLKDQTNHMEKCFMDAACKFGGEIEFKEELMYPAFKINEEDDIVCILKKASHKCGINLVLEATGGGSDTNIVNSKGIQAVDVSVGMDKVHSVEEQISINNLVKAAGFLVEIVKAVE
jgi:tripeptide aminopeptidase